MGEEEGENCIAAGEEEVGGRRREGTASLQGGYVRGGKGMEGTALLQVKRVGREMGSGRERAGEGSDLQGVCGRW